MFIRWDAGAVERGGLENRCARKGTGGSNPSPTASEFSLTLKFAVVSNYFLEVRARNNF